ncbi:GGDEF domain-containing protein [Deinococcus hohokamensis]|uniref:GGDEF domain-containing protein n=1 Tax=Deinococcus hohokamensis TaxID=309883 RepID=A0ABV9I7V3_9DEIO
MTTLSSPSHRVHNLYWWIAWSALVLVLPLRLLNGSPTDLLRDLLYAALTGLCWLLERRYRRRGLLLHLLGLFVLFAGHTLSPGSLAQRLGEGYAAIMFSLVSAGPLFALCAFWGWRGALGGATLAAAGLLLIGTAGSRWGLILAAYPLVLGGTLGLYFHRLLHELEMLWHKLEQTALADSMTGLLNRRALSADYEGPALRAVQAGQPVLLSLWDVNGLKRVNDTEGHAAGDLYLLSFVQALREASPPGDRLYRTGGDEFAGLHFDLDSGHDLYARVRALFPQVSAGWVQLEGQPLADGLAQADQELYHRKAAFYRIKNLQVG